LQSICRDGSKDISFTVSKDDLEAALNIINENNSIIGAEKVIHDENVSKVSVVGAGMTSNPGVAATMFEALYDAGINIQMISTSEIRVSVLIDAKDAEDAVRAIHRKFNFAD
jgi:aspartate kinase